MNTAPLQSDRTSVTESTALDYSDGRRPIRGLRWYIIGLIFVATAINYIDRQSVSLLTPVLSRADQLNISKEQYAWVGTILLAAYAISQSVSGRFYDRYGSRIGFTVSIIIWSLAAMGQSFIVGFGSFVAMTALLGFGEAGNWPGAAKVVAEWFPVRERALGMAIFNSGAAMGSVIAPPLVIWLNLQLGWRITFFTVGTFGFFWLIAWLLLFRTPETHPRLSAEEREHILKGRPVRGAKVTVPWRTLLKYRKVWGLVLARFLVDPVWWLFILWLPTYLNDARGFSIKQIGMFAWAPYLAAAAGSIFGGVLAGRLIGRGVSVTSARRIVVCIAACLMPFGILAAYAQTPMVALACIGVVLFGFQMWISNVQTVPSDLFPGSAVGSVAGLGGAVAAIGSMLFQLSTGWIVTHASFVPVLIIAGLLGPIGTILLVTLVGTIEPVPLPVGAQNQKT